MKGTKLALAVIGGFVAVVMLVVVSVFVSFNNTQKQGVDLETQLTAQYLDNQNELSSYISGFYETIGVADRKSEKLETILVEAVKGRYDGKTSAQPGNGQLFSAIVEAYPDLAALDTYDKVVDYISAGREAYKQKQTKLLDMLRNYDKWRNSGLVKKQMVAMVGFPSENLKAQIGTEIKRGRDAEDQMYLIVTTSDTKTAYETGTMDPLTPEPQK